MIIGMNIMTMLRIVVDTDKIVQWEMGEILLSIWGDAQRRKSVEEQYQLTQVFTALPEAEEQHSCILDVDYPKADMDEYIQAQTHLNHDQKPSLIRIQISSKSYFKESWTATNQIY